MSKHSLDGSTFLRDLSNGVARSTYLYCFALRFAAWHTCVGLVTCVRSVTDLFIIFREALYYV